MRVTKTKEKIPLKEHLRYIYKKMGKAILDYDMLNDGDELFICVSGGIDSLELLKLFQIRQSKIPIKFDGLKKSNNVLQFSCN
ncbi:MAG: hypothetical protein ABIH71_04060 [Candidatus Omnitrophota bacterium]|nr:hypothetical protein [Candidatus Omnitrophota bacterium]